MSAMTVGGEGRQVPVAEGKCPATDRLGWLDYLFISDRRTALFVGDKQ